MSIRQGNNIIANKTVPSIYTAGTGITVNNNVITSRTRFVYEATTASTQWTITHNLNDHPDVVTVDTTGKVFQATVEYDSENVCIVKMNVARAGKAYLN